MKPAAFQAQSFCLREDGQSVWKVSCWMAGRLVVCSPDFNSKGPADAYAAAINQGKRRPEVSA